MLQKVYGFERAIEEIAVVLLNNACKYTQKGFVKFIVSCEGEKGQTDVLLRMDVKDSGIGIPENEIEKIFEPL